MDAITKLRNFEKVIIATEEEARAVYAALDGDPLQPHVMTWPHGDSGYEMSVTLSVYDAAKLRGIKSFDSALPQSWVDVTREHTGLNPVGHFVWSYDPKPILFQGETRMMADVFGSPVPITPEGERILHRMTLFLSHTIPG